MIGETLRVYYKFGDPVDNPKIRQDGAMDGLKYGELYNPIIGYYGETRLDSQGEPKKHSGFDYSVSEGTAVKAVHSGTITKVRIGRLVEVPCEIRNWLVNKNSKLCEDCEYKGKCKQEQTCRKRCDSCKYRGACYGIQVWLRWSEKPNRYAFYAHLSKLGDSLWAKVKGSLADGVSDYNINVQVSKGDVLGYSGCTGNASRMKPYQEHLHFEFRKESEDGPKDHPNYIVETKFQLEKGMYEVTENRRKIDKINKLYSNKVVDDTVRNEIINHIDSKIDTFISKNETEI